MTVFDLMSTFLFLCGLSRLNKGIATVLLLCTLPQMPTCDCVPDA